MNEVYVLNKKGKPLMATKRFRHVRIILKEKKAVPVCNNSFTIRLKYETPDIIQPLTLGIDPGRENIGLSVSNEKGECIFACKVQTNNKQVTKNMQDRKIYRKSRRRYKRQRLQRKALHDNNQLKQGNPDILRSKKPCKSVNISYPGMEKYITCKVIKGKEARFNNRKVPEGRLTPSAKNLIQIHENLVKKIQKFLPISKIILESNSFDFQKLENEDINNWEYSKGPLYGFENYKDYIRTIQNNHCLLCNTPRIEEYHHIVPRSKSGSNSIKNIAGLCKNCHELVHKDSTYSDTLSEYKQGLKKKYEISLLNITYPYIVESLQKILPVEVTTGYETKALRDKNHLPKDHHIDAYLISISKNASNVEIDKSIVNQEPYYIKHFKKKSNNNIHQLGSRIYTLDGKVVAKNRHKSLGQVEDSLEEFLNDNSNSPESRSALYKRLKVSKATRTYTHHKDRKVLPFKCGDIVIRNIRAKDKAKFKKKGKHPRREIYVVNTIDSSKRKILHNSGGEAFKFCKLLKSESLVFV